jgi:hypothetical protein
MADVKVSGLPTDSAPSLTDSIVTLDAETTTTKRSLLSAIATLLLGSPTITGTVAGAASYTTPALVSPTISGLWDGWVAANETWTYASATTITVPTNATNRYSVGDKIKLTQTTVKYFYVIAVSATVLTITGGSDYTLTNAAISANSYSKVASPVGFPQWFAYISTNTGWSSIVTNISRFCLVGRVVTMRCYIQGISNSTSASITAPITPVADAGGIVAHGVFRPADNNVTGAAAGDAFLAPSSTTIVCYKDMTQSAWTASNTKGIQGLVLVYEI